MTVEYSTDPWISKVKLEELGPIYQSTYHETQSTFQLGSAKVDLLLIKTVLRRTSAHRYNPDCLCS